ncbi:hypothetical protein N7520_008767 [Penicillium odoratum]|uniref:uncharacterized protein n=1 Tax=Penicillium odoratum TaxID=1167516 RepID=UPI0025495BBE|nr:uncharacterized protein N7520_008767 [Penicillium odoratum]KAJ5751850.1 hypothetical protein N7520_008767 [Penicillium odoratum]
MVWCWAGHRPVQESLELLIHNIKSGETHDMKANYTELDATFDIISGTMLIKQKIHDPNTRPSIQYETWVQFNQISSKFINLEGLADNSLLFTFKINSPDPDPDPKPKTETETQSTEEGYRSNSKLRICHQVYGWETNTVGKKSSLYNYLMNCSNNEQILQLHLPHHRIEEWKTVAMILFTYRKINTATWHRFRARIDRSDIAGLNWTKLEDRMGLQPVYVVAGVEARAIKPRLSKSVADANITHLAPRFELKEGLRARGFTGLYKAFLRVNDDLKPADLGFKNI